MVSLPAMLVDVSTLRGQSCDVHAQIVGKVVDQVIVRYLVVSFRLLCPDQGEKVAAIIVQVFFAVVLLDLVFGDLFSASRSAP